MNLFWIINRFHLSEIHFFPKPKRPPDGIVSSILFGALITAWYTCIVGKAILWFRSFRLWGTMKLAILYLIQSFWASRNFRGFQLAYQFLNVHEIFDVCLKYDHQVSSWPPLSDVVLPYSASLECKETHQAGVSLLNPGLVKAKDANPGP